jgi:hypothetical protein
MGLKKFIKTLVTERIDFGEGGTVWYDTGGLGGSFVDNKTGVLQGFGEDNSQEYLQTRAQFTANVGSGDTIILDRQDNNTMSKVYVVGQDPDGQARVFIDEVLIAGQSVTTNHTESENNPVGRTYSITGPSNKKLSVNLGSNGTEPYDFVVYSLEMRPS